MFSPEPPLFGKNPWVSGEDFPLQCRQDLELAYSDATFREQARRLNQYPMKWVLVIMKNILFLDSWKSLTLVVERLIVSNWVPLKPRRDLVLQRRLRKWIPEIAMSEWLIWHLFRWISNRTVSWCPGWECQGAVPLFLPMTVAILVLWSQSALFKSKNRQLRRLMWRSNNPQICIIVKS